MKKLFVCPGFCEDCNQEDCPMRNKLDEGFKKELSENFLGEILVKKYETLKEFISPKTIVVPFFNDIRLLIENLERKKEEGILIEKSFIEESLVVIVKNKLPALGIYTEERDQNIKKLFYSIRKIAEKVERYLSRNCNTLFCYDCCIFKICHKESIDFRDLKDLEILFL